MPLAINDDVSVKRPVGVIHQAKVNDTVSTVDFSLTIVCIIVTIITRCSKSIIYPNLGKNIVIITVNGSTHSRHSSG